MLSIMTGTSPMAGSTTMSFHLLAPPTSAGFEIHVNIARGKTDIIVTNWSVSLWQLELWKLDLIIPHGQQTQLISFADSGLGQLLCCWSIDIMQSIWFEQAPTKRICGSPMADCYRATWQNRGVRISWCSTTLIIIAKVLEDKVRYLCGLLACSKHTLVLTGAGASTSAGLLAPLRALSGFTCHFWSATNFFISLSPIS